jgi:hypothetical protein
VALRARWERLTSSPGDAKSSLGDAESSLGDAKSSLGDAESSLGEFRYGRAAVVVAQHAELVARAGRGGVSCAPEGAGEK